LRNPQKSQTITKMLICLDLDREALDWILPSR
jgi:hypothetical protein